MKTIPLLVYIILVFLLWMSQHKSSPTYITSLVHDLLFQTQGIMAAWAGLTWHSVNHLVSIQLT